jgi:hypothetical protein
MFSLGRRHELDENSLNRLSLLPPPHPKRPHQYRQRHRRRLPPVQNRLDDVGREQRQPQDAADVGRGDLGGGDFLGVCHNQAK